MTAETLRIHPDEPEPAAHQPGRRQPQQPATSSRSPPTPSTASPSIPSISAPSTASTSIKTRARHKPLSLLIAEVAQAYELARQLDSAFDRLAEKFWPGPLTIVVKAGSKLPLRVTANTGNVALRVPEAAIPRAVVSCLGLPITATSANLSGMPECTSASGVHDAARRQDPTHRRRRPHRPNHRHHHRRPLRRRQLLDDPARRRHPHPRDRPHPPALEIGHLLKTRLQILPQASGTSL